MAATTAVETLLQNADSAMYEAKKHGRNNYQFYRADLNSTAGEQQALENGLRHAIARRELELYYQPIVSLSTGAIDGVERAGFCRLDEPERRYQRQSRGEERGIWVAAVENTFV
jgi:predicted signal transduction protein with EAL and GGDEF domain